MVLKEGRRYVTYAMVSTRFDWDPGASLAVLEAAGVLLRGLVFKCRRCRATAFYETGEVSKSFTCRRCRLDQIVTRDGWLGAAEPPWHYGLSEVMFQMLDHNGHLPVLATHSEFKDSHWPFDTAHELEVYPPPSLRLRTDGEEDKREVDIVVSDGPRLWVGEATTTDRLGTGEGEMLRLRELAQLADVA